MSCRARAIFAPFLCQLLKHVFQFLSETHFYVFICNVYFTTQALVLLGKVLKNFSGLTNELIGFAA